jgi:hypothetical protein
VAFSSTAATALWFNYFDHRCKEYVARRTQEGKSKREIIRCLKRCIAREAYRVLVSCGACSSPKGPKDESHIAAGSDAV